MIAAVARRALRARPLCFGTASPNGAALLTRRAAARGYLAAAGPQGAAAPIARRAASLRLVAARRAMVAYVASLRGTALRWDKTQHTFPDLAQVDQ